MRILVAHNVSGERTGGMSRTMAFIHDQIELAGHTVDYFCAEDVSGKWQGRRSRFTFPLIVRQYAIKAMREGNPYDIINVHEPSAAAIAGFKKAAGNPVVVVMSYGVTRLGWERELEEIKLDRGGPSWKTRIVYPLTSLWQAKLGLSWADHILCKSTESQAFLVDRFNISPEKITLFYPGADRIFAAKSKERSYARNENLLFAGTWIKRKGCDDLIKAFSALAMRYPSLKLIVLGGGDSSANIKGAFPENLRERVLCIQTNNDIEMAEALANADIYILPSLFEGTPLTMIEAMMSGIPVVTTSTCGMRDVIESERNGLLVPIRSPDYIFNAVQRLINDEALRAKLGRAAQCDALKKYTWEEAAKPVLRLYEKLFTERVRDF